MDEETFKEEANRTLWNANVNAVEEQAGKIEQDDRRTWYTLRRKLLMEYLEKNGGRLREAETQAAMKVGPK